MMALLHQNMSIKILALCFLGLLLRKKFSFAATVSGIAILLIVVRSIVQFVAHRRRLSRLVRFIKINNELNSSLARLTHSYGVI
jgi:hypothetical protein